MNVRKLTSEEFAQAVRNGLGSAPLHVSEYGDSEIENELLEACLSSLVFDAQLESGRGRWLASMVARSGQISMYAAAIKEKLLKNTKDEATIKQLIVLAAELFDHGFGEFKEILLSLSLSNQSEEVVLCLTEALVDVASFAGLESGVQAMQEFSCESWIKVALYEYACESLDGAEKVNCFLERKAKLDLEFERFRMTVQKELESDQKLTSPIRKSSLTLSQVLSLIDEDPRPRFNGYKFKLFGKTATDEELKTILSLIEKEDDSDRLACFMEIFGFREIPKIPRNARQMIFSDDLELQRIARNALSKITSPVLREYGIELIESGSDRDIVCGLNLLELNYRSEDIETIGKSLRKLEDINWIHWGAGSIITMARNENTQLLVDELIWIYSFNPCGNCRGNALELLINKDCAPAQMLFEAQWDAEEETRILARAQIEK